MDVATKTIKRNGVYIILPEVKLCTNNDILEQKKIDNNKVRQSIAIKSRQVVAERKIGCCIRCGDACWRSDVNYCWDCYKYEHYESR